MAAGALRRQYPLVVATRSSTISFQNSQTQQFGMLVLRSHQITVLESEKKGKSGWFSAKQYRQKTGQ
jgi:hypothetical protein